MNRNSHQSKARRNIVIIVVVSLLILIMGVLVNNVSGSTKPIRDAADTIDVPSEWSLISERIEPPRFFCLNGGSCPELDRKWQVNRNDQTAQNLGRLFDQSWSYVADSDCSSFNSLSDSCSIEIRREQYSGRIFIESYDTTTINISLSLRPL